MSENGMLEGKVALVTGAASGIGRGTALRFAEQGAKVVLADQLDEDGERLRQEIEQKGGTAAYVHCDVSQPADVERAVEAARSRFGRLDIVFANAGINGVWAPIEELTPEEWDRTQSINLKGTYLTLHFAIPLLRASGGGSIVITSSVNGNRTFSNAGTAAYSTSKAGQVALMKIAALELGQYGIRVNAVCPGAIHTNIDQRTQKRDTEKIAIHAEIDNSKLIDEGQGEPQDVADVCLFLASDLSRHVSGVEIYVDGGASLVR